MIVQKKYNIEENLVEKNYELFFCGLAFLFFMFFPLVGSIGIAIVSPFLDKYIRLIFSFIVVLFFVLFYASSMPFSDLSEYLDVYNDIDLIQIGRFERFGAGIEVVLLLIMKFSDFFMVGNQFFFLFLTYLIVQVSVLFISYKLDVSLYLLVFVIFNISLGFLEFNSILLRNSLAAVFFMLGVVCVGRKKTLFYSLSFFSHLSITIFLCFIFFRKFFRYSVINIFALFFVFLLVFSFFPHDVFQYMYSKTIVALTAKYSHQKTGYLILTLINLMIVLASIYISWIENKKSRKLVSSHKNYIYILILSSFLFFVASSNINLSTRLGFFCFAYMPFFFQPFLSNIFVSKKKKVLMLYSYLFFNVFPFFYSMWHVSYGENHFSFLNQRPVTYSYMQLIDDSIEKLSIDKLVRNDAGNH